ncbi:YtxH domain-containing protein [Bacillus sp. FJAT-47783]|uniref:YtxH domain-containing protein n=1 Tax=Bacillus sp. FJAT-47783 TaxID=2922712 RepID=UPI001FADEF31|nr:YtxH domain-containing protein [Bacillus sp. FJAT-47783]
MANNKSFFLGFMIGGIISGAAVLLSTPSSGKDVRNRVQQGRKRLDDLLQELRKEGSHLKEQITDSAKESISIVKDVTTDINKSIQAWKKDIEPHTKEIQHELKEIEAKMKELEQSIRQTTLKS